MEYSFAKNKTQYHVRLEEYFMVYSVNGVDQVIRYAAINRIRLHRSRLIDNIYVYNCSIHITDGSTIRLQSYSINGDELKSMFNHYNQFIRVLHMHLQSKSHAKFSYGMSYYRLSSYISVAGVVLLLAYYFNTLFTGSVFILYMMVPLVMVLCFYNIFKDKPGTYTPDFIPYHILPGTA